MNSFLVIVVRFIVYWHFSPVFWCMTITPHAKCLGNIHKLHCSWSMFGISLLIPCPSIIHVDVVSELMSFGSFHFILILYREIEETFCKRNFARQQSMNKREIYFSVWRYRVGTTSRHFSVFKCWLYWRCSVKSFFVFFRFLGVLDLLLVVVELRNLNKTKAKFSRQAF